MIRVVLSCCILIVGCADHKPSTTPSPAAVKKVAQELADATLRGDFATLIDHTYIGLVDAMGGREKAIELTKGLMKDMTDSGMKVDSFTVSEPGDFFYEGGKFFVVVPTKMEITAPQGDSPPSHTSSASLRMAATWTFADGSGIEKHKGESNQLFPKFPAKLQLPAQSPPEMIRG